MENVRTSYNYHVSKNLETGEDCQSVAEFANYLKTFKDAALGLTIAQATEGLDIDMLSS